MLMTISVNFSVFRKTSLSFLSNIAIVSAGRSVSKFSGSSSVVAEWRLSRSRNNALSNWGSRCSGR
jgi:hypothetical protein